MRWSKLICALLAACLWLLGPISPQLHFLLVQHSVCDEHGELVEAQQCRACEDVRGLVEVIDQVLQFRE